MAQCSAGVAQYNWQLTHVKSQSCRTRVANTICNKSLKLNPHENEKSHYHFHRLSRFDKPSLEFQSANVCRIFIANALLRVFVRRYYAVSGTPQITVKDISQSGTTILYRTVFNQTTNVFLIK